MGNKKINQLPSATSVGNGDVTVIYQNGVTKQIPVSQIGGGGGGIEIPKPQLHIGSFNGQSTQTLSVYYNHVGSNEWLNHNPQLWLERFITRRKKGIGSGNYKRPGNKWVHPTDANSTNVIYNDLGQKMYAGQTDIPLTSEWSVPSTWKTNTILPNFNFDALPYWRYNHHEITYNSWPVDIVSEGINLLLVNPTGQSNPLNTHTCWFRFRFVIQDPNNSGRILMGTESDIIKSYKQRLNDSWYGIALRFRKI